VLLRNNGDLPEQGVMFMERWCRIDEWARNESLAISERRQI